MPAVLTDLTDGSSRLISDEELEALLRPVPSHRTNRRVSIKAKNIELGEVVHDKDVGVVTANGVTVWPDKRTVVSFQGGCVKAYDGDERVTVERWAQC